jgi:hypothetical protein
LQKARVRARATAGRPAAFTSLLMVARTIVTASLSWPAAVASAVALVLHLIPPLSFSE